MSTMDGDTAGDMAKRMEMMSIAVVIVAITVSDTKTTDVDMVITRRTDTVDEKRKDMESDAR